MYPIARGRDPTPQTTAATVRVWYEPPARYRQEYDVSGPIGETVISVWDGPRSWMYAPPSGAIEQESGGPSPDLLLDPAQLIPSLDFVVGERVRYLERDAVEVQGVARPSEYHGFTLEPGADEHRLLVDADRGVLLRVASFISGQEHAVRSVVGISFDETLADEVFTLVLPPGEEIRSPADLHQVDHISIEEAVRRAPFTVFIPGRSPEGFVLDIRFVAAQERPRTPATVVLSYLPNDGTHCLSVREAAEGELELLGPAEPEALERDGTTYRVVAPERSTTVRPTQVFLDRDGTSIEISSDLDLELLLEVAASLVPASAVPPRLV